MAKKNILLLLLTLLIASGIDCKAQNNDVYDYSHPDEVNIMKLDMNIFCLLNLLEDNMPLTRQKIMNIGLELIKDGWGGGRIDYISIPIELNDGTILDGIELRDINTKFQRGTFFLLYIKNKRIAISELKDNFGEFILYDLPRGDSADEKITYRKRVGKFNIFAGYDQKESDLLLVISFNSIERLKQ